MVDPLTGLGIVSNLFQLLDFSAKVVAESYKFVKSSSDTLPNNVSAQQLADEYVVISDRVKSSYATVPTIARSKDDAVVERLATACQGEATKLIGVLLGLKVQARPDGSKPILQSFKQTVRTRRKRADIDLYQGRLRDVQSQLATALLHLIRSNQTDMYGGILECIESKGTANTTALLAAKSDILRSIEQFRQTQEHIAEQQRIKADQHSADTRRVQAAVSAGNERLGSVLLMNGNIKAKSIVDSLRFPSMRQRRDDIDTAHKSTFHWIFESEMTVFQRWLKCADGLFWISGKAGSGKSTLMKFLSRHGMTKEHLKEWQGLDSLTLVDYYFWHPGSIMQKSQQGLLQSLLYEILAACPELIPIVSPKRWQADELWHRNPDPWSRDELSSAFHAFEEAQSLKHKFCFFIDGLDEYHGDQARLVQDLTELSQSLHVKLCVSSRPWNAFTAAFTNIPWKLRVEHLTCNDITHYVKDQLLDASAILSNHPPLEDDQSCTASECLEDEGFAEGKNHTPKTQIEDSARADYEHDFNALTSEIVEKAQGVFLWVFIVVRSLREGLAEGDSMSVLRRRVDLYPADLEEFFRKLILDRISKAYLADTAQALRLAMTLVGRHSSFLYFWLLRRGSTNKPGFGVAEEPALRTTRQLKLMIEQTRTFLNACCKDFLYVRSDTKRESTQDQFWVRRHTVEFLHRTVYDFLDSEEMQQLLDKHSPPHFRDDDFLCNLTLAQLKMIPSDHSDLCKYFDVTAQEQSLRFDRHTKMALDLAVLRNTQYQNHFCSEQCSIHGQERNS